MTMADQMLTDPLTEREEEILSCLVDGLSNREIAGVLYLSYQTVKWYNTQIYSKLGVSNRDEAVERALVLGLPNKTSDAHQQNGKHNLPQSTTEFVGREEEINELQDLLAGKRLLTILAPGGMGKTRLALEVARRQIGQHTNGVFFIPLAPLSSTNDIVTTLADSIGFVFQGEQSPIEQLVAFLQSREMLLVLDNFEHLMAGAGLVSDIIKATTATTILVTSRERLNLHGENVYDLRGLVFPTWETPEDALEYDAVKLFMQSARRARPKFTLRFDQLDFLARICRLTAGMPLGIELAAGWVDVLSLEQIANEIQSGIDILETEMRDIPKRHRSLRATFERTWQRLTTEEQEVFSRLSVFRGGFTLESAQAVAEASIRQLRKLVQKALIQTEVHKRYAIHELVRQFGAGKLEESAESATIQANHAAYFTDFMLKREHDLKNGNQLIGLTLIDPDYENVRLAWNYVVDHHQWEHVPNFRYSLWFYWDMRARLTDALSMTGYALDKLRALPPSAIVQLTIGRMLAWSSWASNTNPLLDTQNIITEAIELLQGLDDGIEDLIIAQHALSSLGMYLDEKDRTQSLVDAKQNYALAEKLGDPTWLGQTASFVTFVGMPHKETTYLNLAKKWFTQSRDRHGLWMCGLGDASVLISKNQLAETYDTLLDAERLIAPFNSPAHLAVTNRLEGIIALKLGDHKLAVRHYRYAVRRQWESGYMYEAFGILLRLAQVLLYEEDYETACAIMLVLDDTPQGLVDYYYNLDKASNLQLGYEELKTELLNTLQATKLDHLWDKRQQLSLSDLMNRVLYESKES